MAKRGPKPVAPDDLYQTACGFYAEFRELAGLLPHWSFDRDSNEALKKLTRELINYDRTKFEQREEMIRSGRLTPAAREQKLQQLKKDIEYAKRERTLNFAYDASGKTTKGGANPDVVQALLAATIPQRIREICETQLGSEMVKVFNPRTTKTQGQPIAVRSHFYETLWHQAGRFIAAKNHTKFPNGRPRKSTLLEQLWFLSRAIAAAAHNRAINTVLNLGLKRPDHELAESQAANSKIRKRTAGREISSGSQRSKGASVG
jgi:hypothetical protein